ncbi:hypothetical protein [Neomesorhizobium albiziae]|uniref:hypothetical protein n=1 Tax=Neomesorhizobium albiziae TaxID=335020 RepID=UPI00122D2A3D|nr:hypothetical protein [Mesorhizobium albiziae]
MADPSEFEIPVEISFVPAIPKSSDCRVGSALICFQHDLFDNSGRGWPGSQWRVVLNMRNGELYVEHSDDTQERHTLEEFLFAPLARNELQEHAAKSLVALLANVIGRSQASQERIDRSVIPARWNDGWRTWPSSRGDPCEGQGNFRMSAPARSSNTTDQLQPTAALDIRNGRPECELVELLVSAHVVFLQLWREP